MKSTSIGKIADVQTGPFGSQLHKEDYITNGTPIVTVEHLGQKTFTTQNLPCVSAKDKVRLTKYTMRSGDIIFSRVGSVDRCSFATGNNDGWLFSGRCLRLRVTDINVNSEYLYYYFCQEAVKELIRNHAVGATMPSLNTKLLSELPFAYPEIEQQTRIVSLLSNIDAKIERNAHINQNLEQQAQAIFKSWFVDFEPFQDGKFVDSECGPVPEGWQVGTLKEMLDIRYGKDHKKLSEGKIPVYGSGGLMRLVDKALYSGESVLIPRKGTLNNVMRVTGDFWTVDTMFYSVPKRKGAAKFAFHILHNMDLASMNSGSAVPSMTTDILNSIVIVVPPQSVLDSFDETTKALWELHESNLHESRRLATLRDTLLPKLMSGEIDVSEVEI